MAFEIEDVFVVVLKSRVADEGEFGVDGYVGGAGGEAGGGPFDEFAEVPGGAVFVAGEDGGHAGESEAAQECGFVDEFHVQGIEEGGEFFGGDVVADDEDAGWGGFKMCLDRLQASREDEHVLDVKGDKDFHR